MNKITKCAKLPPVKYEPNPPFGTVFPPHILKMNLKLDGPNDYSAEIKKLEPELYHPTLTTLHYGQSIFEGLKAYLQAGGGVGVFRPDLHARRFRDSAKRMMMADLPEEVFLNCVKEYVTFLA